MIILTALNEIEWQKAKKLLDESLIEEVLPIPNCGGDTSFEDSRFLQFKTGQEKNKPLKISLRKSDDKETDNIQLVGVKHVVVEAKMATKEFIESLREIEHEFTVKLSEDKSKFLEKHFSDLVKPIESNCKVSMRLEHGIVRWKGPPESFPEGKASLEELCKRILEKDKIFEFPGVEQLFKEGKAGGRLLVHLGKTVHIRTSLSRFPRQRFVSESSATKKHVEEVRMYVKPVVGPNESSENLTILLKHGRIENEQVG